MITDKGTPNCAPFSGHDKDYNVTAFVRALEPKLAVTTFRTDKDGPGCRRRTFAVVFHRPNWTTNGWALFLLRQS